MIKRSFITHVLVNACFSKRPFYASYLTYVIRCRTLNMHYSIYMFTLRLTCVKYAFWKRTFNTCCTFFYVVKIMLPYDMVPQCKKLMHRIIRFPLNLKGERRLYSIVSYEEKKEEIWLSPMTKTPTPTEMSKGQSDNTNNATKKFDYTAVAETHMNMNRDFY